MPSLKQWAIALAFVMGVSLQKALPQTPSAAPRVSKVGVVRSITGRTVVLKPETGNQVAVTLLDDARLLRLEPGQTDLRTAQTITIDQIQPGDRLLVRGTPAAKP